MTTLRTIYHLARADFLERTRQRSFLLVLGVTIYLGYMFAPLPTADYLTLVLGTCRGLYNSAWLGSIVAAVSIFCLGLTGFYLVNNGVKRDRQTGVGQIIATTPLTKWAYIFGKMLSNLAVLLVILGIFLVVALVLQLIGGEELRIDLWALIAPSLFIVFPTMTLVSGIAVLFETLPWLRGGMGNVAYFFLFISAVSWPLGAVISNNMLLARLDPLGVWALASAMIRAGTEVDPSRCVGFSFGRTKIADLPSLHIFQWEGIQWTADIWLSRFMWLGVALGLVLLGAIFFDRFDTVYSQPWWRQPRKALPATDDIAASNSSLAKNRHKLKTLADCPVSLDHPGFFYILRAELALMLKGHRWWWYVIAILVMLGGLFVSVEKARQFWLPIAWIWPLFVWSAMGNRETQYNTWQLVFSSARTFPQQLLAMWGAGLMVTLILRSGVGVNLLLARKWMYIGAWLVSILFIPSLALALGVWSGSSKLFEVIYVTLWYFGPLHPKDMPGLDFMGAGDPALVNGTPVFFTLATLALMMIACTGRWRQLRD